MEMLSLKGKYIIKLLRKSEVLQEIIIDNLITTVGKNMVAQLVTEQFQENMFQYIAFGDNNTSPVVGNTILASEVGRVAIATQGAVTNVVTLTATVPPDEIQGFTLQEIGLFGIDATGTANTGHLFSRALISPSINKTDITVNVTYQLTIS